MTWVKSGVMTTPLILQRLRRTSPSTCAQRVGQSEMPCLSEILKPKRSDRMGQRNPIMRGDIYNVQLDPCFGSEMGADIKCDRWRLHRSMTSIIKPKS